MTDGTSIVRSRVALEPAQKQALSTSIDALDSTLAGYLASLALPTHGILAPIAERQAVLAQFESVVELLPEDQRPSADYLSKYCIAISIGLFDAALNFLWDETIRALRRHADRFDLQYFFDLAEKREDARRTLKTFDDFGLLDDFVLIDTCARVGIISEVDRERIRHVNYMRNHASAAHPTNATVNGHEMVGWLSNCLRYAITANPDKVALETKRLLHNVRSQPIGATEIPQIVSAIANLPQLTVDDLLHGLFGLYADVKTTSPARENVLALAPGVWGLASEQRRREVGARIGSFAKHGESDRVALAQAFLSAAGGLAYRDESVLVAELLDKLRNLRAAHFGMNNFYNEWPHAASLAQSLPPTGSIPRAAAYEFVKTVGLCAIGNGNGYRDGVDETAMQHYNTFIARWSDPEIATFVRCFGDTEFTGDLPNQKPDARARHLLTFFRGKTTNIPINRAIDALLQLPVGSLGKAGNATAYKAAVANLRA